MTGCVTGQTRRRPDGGGASFGAGPGARAADPLGPGARSTAGGCLAALRMPVPAKSDLVCLLEPCRLAWSPIPQALVGHERDPLKRLSWRDDGVIVLAVFTGRRSEGLFLPRTRSGLPLSVPTPCRP